MAKTITLRVDDSTYDTIKRAADGGRRSMSSLIEEATINYIFANEVVDDDEMAEILADDEDLKKGINDIENGRYRIVG